MRVCFGGLSAGFRFGKRAPGRWRQRLAFCMR
jgi:hypothetical protein